MNELPDRKPIDWEAIEREYRAGQFSLREIGRRHSITDTAIRKKAKAENWTRILADKVRQAVREKLVRTDSSQSGSHPQRATDAEIIEAASEIGKQVQLTHRKDLEQLRAIGAIITTRLAAHLNGEQPEGAFIGEKESVGDLFEKLSRVKSRLIPLERQAFNLDTDAEAEKGRTLVDLSDEALAAIASGGSKGAA